MLANSRGLGAADWCGTLLARQLLRLLAPLCPFSDFCGMFKVDLVKFLHPNFSP